MDGDEPQNVLHFPGAQADPGVGDRLDDIAAEIGALRHAVTDHRATIDARLGLDDRVTELEDRLAEQARIIEVIARPGDDVANVAQAAHQQGGQAFDDLAGALLRQPTWWSRHRAWAIPALISAGAAAIGVAYLVGKRRADRRLARVLAEHDRLALRAREAERRYLAIHAAYAEVRSQLAGEQARPLHSHYDQRTFRTVRRVPERVLERTVPVVVDRVVREQPIVQPTVRIVEPRIIQVPVTHRKTTKRTHTIERIIEKQPIIQRVEVKQERPKRKPKKRSKAPKRSRAIDEALARLRKPL